MRHSVVRVYYAAVFLTQWAGNGRCEIALYIAFIFRNDKWIHGGHLFAARGIRPILLFPDYQKERKEGRDTALPSNFSGMCDYNFPERIVDART